MEIEVGEYVRTDRGIIAKVDEIRLGTNREKKVFQNIYELDNGLWTVIDYIKKHSKNIIDLVEAGDYVNGCYVEDIFEKGKKIFNTVPESDKGILKNRELCICKPHSYGGIDWIRKEEDIKSILTHEQFANVEYKVEEEK